MLLKKKKFHYPFWWERHQFIREDCSVCKRLNCLTPIFLSNKVQQFQDVCITGALHEKFYVYLVC